VKALLVMFIFLPNGTPVPNAEVGLKPLSMETMEECLLERDKRVYYMPIANYAIFYYCSENEQIA
jgi:hypothetical protein